MNINRWLPVEELPTDSDLVQEDLASSTPCFFPPDSVLITKEDYEEARQLILAKEIQLRRGYGWWANSLVPPESKDKWRVDIRATMDDEQFREWWETACFDTPAKALIEADKWLRENMKNPQINSNV